MGKKVLSKECKYVLRLIGKTRNSLRVVGSQKGIETNDDYTVVIIECDVDHEIESVIFLPIELSKFLGIRYMRKEAKNLVNEILDMYHENRVAISTGCFDLEGLDAKQINHIIRYDVGWVMPGNMRREIVLLYRRFVFESSKVRDKHYHYYKYINDVGYFDEETGYYYTYYSMKVPSTGEFKIIECTYSQSGEFTKRSYPDLVIGYLLKRRAGLIMRQQLVHAPQYIKNLIRIMNVEALEYKWLPYKTCEGIDIVEDYNAKKKKARITREMVQEQIDKIIPFFPEDMQVPRLKDFFSVHLRSDVCMVQLDIPFKDKEGYLTYKFLMPVFEDESLREWEISQGNCEYEENTMVEFLVALTVVMDRMQTISWESVRNLFGYTSSFMTPSEDNCITYSILHVYSSNVDDNPYALIHRILVTATQKSEVTKRLGTGDFLSMYNVMASKKLMQRGYGLDSDLRYHFAEINLEESLAREKLVMKDYKCSLNEWSGLQAHYFQDMIIRNMNHVDEDFKRDINDLFYLLHR